VAVARDDLHLHVGTSADSKGLTDAAKKLDDTKESSDGLGTSLKETGKKSKALDGETERLEFRLKELGRETEKTRKSSDGLGSSLKNLFKQLREGGVAKGGQIPEIPSVITGSGLGGPAGIAAIASVATPALGALAVTIGGVIAGAVAGTTVGGGMLGGILSATRDSRVRAAASEFGDSISKEFFSGGAVFADPVADSLRILQDDFAALNLGATFAKAAPDVETLAHGIGDMAKNLMPGFNRVMDRSGEYTGIFAQGLADTGEAISGLLTTLVNSKGAAEGLRGAFVGLDAAIDDGGDFLGAMSDGFHFFALGAATATGALEDFVPVQILSGGMQDEWNDRWEKTAQVGEYASTAMHRFNEEASQQRVALDAADQSMMALYGSTTFVVGEVIKLDSAVAKMHDNFLKWASVGVNGEQALDDLAESLKENGRSLDVTTQQGRDNTRALLALAAAARETAQATYDETGSLANAQKSYDHYRVELLKVLATVGIVGAAAEKLADAWLGIPGHVSTVIETTYVTRKISSDEYKEEQARGARHQKRASGGPVAAGQAYLVGDGGRTEVLQMGSQSGHVYPSTGAWQSAMGGGAQRLQLEISAKPSGDALLDTIISMLSYAVRTRAGGDVQALLSGSRI
jgi:hypothetical protein